MKELIDRLERDRLLSKEELITLLEHKTPELSAYLFSKADGLRRSYYDNHVYIRGLIEFTNYCTNNCLYCGLRRDNTQVERYRLSKEDILECCHQGHRLGFRTFVLQGGEDPAFTDERLEEILREIKQYYPDNAITLSIGERSRESYQRLFDAGADRYLLRFESSTDDHYGLLHPPELSLENRKQCLRDLKEIGYILGTGFMVGSPHQTTEHIANDLLFIAQLQPHMVGMGPFIPHHATPFSGEPAGTLEDTLFLLGLLRLILPHALLPATTALGTIHPKGRELGMKAGANVVMPNLSPQMVRKNYLLYDNKISTGEEAAEGKSKLEQSMKTAGYQVVVSRGDCNPTHL